MGWGRGILCREEISPDGLMGMADRALEEKFLNIFCYLTGACAAGGGASGQCHKPDWWDVRTRLIHP